MTLPSSVRPFDSNTMIVVAGNERAKFLRAANSEVEVLAFISSKEEEQPGRDHQNSVTGAGDVRSTSSNDNRDDLTRAELHRKINEDLLRRFRHDEFESIVLCDAQQNMNELKAALHTDLQARIKGEVPKNLSHMDELDIATLAREAM